MVLCFKDLLVSFFMQYMYFKVFLKQYKIWSSKKIRKHYVFLAVYVPHSLLKGWLLTYANTSIFFWIVYVWTMHKIFICFYTTLMCTRILPKPELSELFSLLCCHFLKVKNAYKLMTILIDMNVYYQVNKKFIINEINF